MNTGTDDPIMVLGVSLAATAACVAVTVGVGAATGLKISPEFCAKPAIYGIENLANTAQTFYSGPPEAVAVRAHLDPWPLPTGGKPLHGAVPVAKQGDVWAATGDSPNSWVSVGTAYPDRLCRTHVEVTGSEPAWGTDRGPEPVTGKPTAFRCCA